MKRQVPRRIVVFRDKQEKNPLVFPERLRWFNGHDAYIIETPTEKANLIPFGCDYLVKDFESIVRIERKGSIDELRNNLLTGDRTRQDKSIEKLTADCDNPYLLLDVSLAQSFNPGYSTVDPNKVLDALFRKIAASNLRLLWVSGGQSNTTRQMLGTRVLQLMWDHIWHTLENS